MCVNREMTKGELILEIVSLQARIKEYQDDYKSIMEEVCEGKDDRIHCTCVPALKLRIKELEEEREDAILEAKEEYPEGR